MKIKRFHCQVFTVLLQFKTDFLQPLVTLTPEGPTHLYLTFTWEMAWARRGRATSRTTVCSQRTSVSRLPLVVSVPEEPLLPGTGWIQRMKFQVGVNWEKKNRLLCSEHCSFCS